jgi:WD40 repeat protein
MFRSANGALLAIASTFPLLANPPGRASYMGQRMRQRLALCRRGELAPFAVFDEPRLPINDISFHPSEPVIVVAGGSYDGGYQFNGELFFWNWATGRFGRAAKAVPEVDRCDFSADGKRLDVLVRPWDEGWETRDEAFDRVYPVSIPYEGLGTGDDIVVELDRGQAIVHHTLEYADREPRRRDDLDLELKEWFGVDAILRRGAIWDVAWIDRKTVAAVHDDCVVEIHDVATGAVNRIEKDGCRGASLLRTKPPIVASYAIENWLLKQSRLFKVSGGTLVDIATFEGSYSFVASMDGNVLGRFDRSHRGGAGEDVILDANSGDARHVDLGHYDCFNHFIGIDGAPDLFILQGTPETQHLRKRLCRVRPDESVETLWYVLPPDDTHANHAMECLGHYIDDELGPSLIISGRHYDPNPSKGNRAFVFRRQIGPRRPVRNFFGLGRSRSDGKMQEAWRVAASSSASAIVDAPTEGLVIVAFLDGTLSLLKAINGAVVATGKVTVDGLATVIYSMDFLGSTLAVGTFDGRIGVLDLDQLREHAKAATIELA